MPLRVLDLPKQFRPSTSIVYPPFKNGRYMEEYFYDYVMENKDIIESDRVYIPIFWTNLQNHPGFSKQKRNYEILLLNEIVKMPTGTKYFTIVQHDDGPLLKIIEDVIIFGACTGDIPLPLIYEDTNNFLINKPRQKHKQYLASFIGTYTHNIRTTIHNVLHNKHEIYFMGNKDWTNSVQQSAADLFVDTTLNSKFCLAPRGYGRSSFRFFESMLLDTIPVYFWDDNEWLPYKELLDYSDFTVSIKKEDIPRTYEILKGISDKTYSNMLENLKRIRYLFSLNSMCEYIISKI